MYVILFFPDLSNSAINTAPNSFRLPFTSLLLPFLGKGYMCFTTYAYAHTNRFCVVQENIKPEVLTVQAELARSVH